MKQIVFWVCLALFLFFGGQWLGETVADQMVSRAEVNLDNEEFDKALATLDRVDFLLDWTEAGQRTEELRSKIHQAQDERNLDAEREARRQREYDEIERQREERERRREAEERTP